MKISLIRKYTSSNMGTNWNPKMVISRVAERFPKGEFDAMPVNMSPRASHIQKGSKITETNVTRAAHAQGTKGAFELHWRCF